MKNICWVFCVMLLVSCSNGPKEINFGNDKCDYCTMTIADKPYAAEVVTEKGKVYKFDSSECMLSYAEENTEVGYAQFLTATMDKPGELQDATNCTYLVSPNLPSPMGANLTAFSSQALAKDAKEEYEGDVYSFEDIKSGTYKNTNVEPTHMNADENMHHNSEHMEGTHHEQGHSMKHHGNN